MIEALHPFTWYTFSVAAQNKVGRGPFSQIIRYKTDGEKPSGNPRNVVVSLLVILSDVGKCSVNGASAQAA